VIPSREFPFTAGAVNLVFVRFLPLSGADDLKARLGIESCWFPAKPEPLGFRRTNRPGR